MILLPILALVVGFVLFYWLPNSGYQTDEAWARYTAIAVLAGLDTVLGGLRARLNDDFDDLVFVSGFFVNALLAGGLVYLGERLGLETGLGDERVSAMMIAAVVVFGTRIFNNLAALRRMLIDRWRDPSKPDASQVHTETESNSVEMSTRASV
jgi:small basic protein